MPITDTQLADLRRHFRQCAAKRQEFRAKNVGTAHDEAYISGHLLHSSILRFLDALPFLISVQNHLSARPKDKLFLSRALVQLRRTGLRDDRKALNSRTRWTTFDKKCKEAYLKLLDTAFALFEVKP